MPNGQTQLKPEDAEQPSGEGLSSSVLFSQIFRSEPIVDTCSPQLALHLERECGDIPDWFQREWDQIFSEND